MQPPLRPDRNIALELIRVTEAAAIAAARWAGRGDKNAADGAAVDAMRFVLGAVAMDGVVVIGEGEKDEAPMLYNGEQIGDGRPPLVDVAVDPVDGTRPSRPWVATARSPSSRSRARHDVRSRALFLHEERSPSDPAVAGRSTSTPRRRTT